jgi:hypothetical protein
LSVRREPAFRDGPKGRHLDTWCGATGQPNGEVWRES